MCPNHLSTRGRFLTNKITLEVVRAYLILCSCWPCAFQKADKTGIGSDDLRIGPMLVFPIYSSHVLVFFLFHFLSVISSSENDPNLVLNEYKLTCQFGNAFFATNQTRCLRLEHNVTNLKSIGKSQLVFPSEQQLLGCSSTFETESQVGQDCLLVDIASELSFTSSWLTDPCFYVHVC